MGQSVKTRQYMALTVLMALALAAAAWSYHLLERRWVIFRHAETAAAAGHQAEAAGLYRDAINNDLDEPNALLKASQAALAAGDEATALAALERAMTARRRDMDIVRRAAELHLRRGGLSQAEALLEKTDPGETAGQLLLAEIKRGRQDYAAAEDIYRRLMAQRPQDALPLARLAETLAWQGRFDQATELFRQALDRAGSEAAARQVRLRLARVLSWQGRLDEAIAEYRLALGEKP